MSSACESYAGAVAASRNAELADALSSPFTSMWHDVERSAPVLARHPRLCFGTAAALATAGAAYFWRFAQALGSLIPVPSVTGAI